MDLQLNSALAEGYKSGSQRSRRLTEGWVGDNMFCPRCGHINIEHYKNNKPVADFYCPHCYEQYELKSMRGSIKERVSDGAYITMIERITSSTCPDFFFLSYSMTSLCITNFIIVPKHFFIPSIIEKRPPLAPNAKRSGWVGCNIILSCVPEQGRISVIQNGTESSRKQVLKQLNHSSELAKGDNNVRSWTFDVLNCVNSINSESFTLADMYKFEKTLADRHPDNHNINAKIRQQLQILRNAGYIIFLGHGVYRKVNI